MRRRVAFLLFLALAAAHTWPVASAPARLSLNHNADAELNAWALAWIAHTLPRDPRHLFDGNIFAPEPRTVTYTDPLIVPAVAVAPVWWLTGAPVLTFNVSMWLGLALTGWATWLLAREWTRSDAAALVAGSLAAFNPHLLTRLPHVAASWMWTIPLALLLADRLLDDHHSRLRTTVALALVVAATAATSLYTLAFVGIITGIMVAVALATRTWSAAIRIAGAALAGLVIALPVLVPYAQFAAGGAYRPIESVADFSATLPGYLNTPALIHAGWSQAFFDRDVSAFFAGVAALMLAALGLAAWRGPSQGRRRMTVLALGVSGVLLSLGPATPIYTWLYEWVMPLRGLRAAARFGYLYLVAVAVAASWGLAWIVHRVPNARLRRVLPMAAVLLVSAEAWTAPIATRLFEGVPPIYRHVAQAPDPVLLMEVPFWPPDAFFQNGEYVINATAHWRPLMNGYSGFLPQSYRDRAATFWFLPESWALEQVASTGATHVMVHLERFAPHERPDVEAALRDQRVLSLIASDSRGHRLYRVR